MIWNNYIHCISWQCIWVRNESCISPLSKNRFHAPTVGRKKKPARDAPWVDSMNFQFPTVHKKILYFVLVPGNRDS